MSYDLSPNDGSFYIPPVDEDEQQKISKERAEAMQVLPFLEKTVDWFELQAAEAEKLTNIDLKHPKLTGEQQIAIYQQLAKILRLKKGELKSYISTYDIKQR